MDPQEARWRPTSRQLMWAGGIAALAFLIIVICGYLFEWKWTGLPRTKVSQDVQPTKTMWDWLGLLIVPAVLALGGYLFNRSESRRTKEDAEQRAQHEILQAYFDHIGELLLDEDSSLRQSKEGDEVRDLARARTLTTLARLDGDIKGRVVQFLFESGLITSRGQLSAPIIDLSGADLTKADLTTLDLTRLAVKSENTMGLNLNKADLSEAVLENVKLIVAQLVETNLSKANLKGADLSIANLEEADLSGADLRGIQITHESIPVTERLQLAKSLNGATMPEGERYEDWLGTDEGQEWLWTYKSNRRGYTKLNLGWRHENVDGDYEAWIKTTEGKMWLKAMREHVEDSGST